MSSWDILFIYTGYKIHIINITHAKIKPIHKNQLIAKILNFYSRLSHQFFLQLRGVNKWICVLEDSTISGNAHNIPTITSCSACTIWGVNFLYDYKIRPRLSSVLCANKQHICWFIEIHIHVLNVISDVFIQMTGYFKMYTVRIII